VSRSSDSRPLIVHVVFRFDVGGLENGVVNLINNLPAALYRHAVIALTEVTDFRRRIKRGDVEFIELHKGAGHGIWQAPRLFRLFRKLRPAIVHTRNLAALEASLPAWLAGVPIRIHSEHGWDMSDLTGTEMRYVLTRRLYRPFVSRYIALSKDIERYLIGRIGIAAPCIEQIYNGVDVALFAPVTVRPPIEGNPFGADAWLVGTVGRMQTVKDHVTLARAFALALRRDPEAARCMRLLIVGDGPTRPAIEAVLRENDCAQYAWLPGKRDNVAQFMNALDCFVLPSLNEGISNTILEAMACGLPIVATRVGGNPELLDDELTGELVASGDAEAICSSLLRLFHDRDRCKRLGSAARDAALRRFSIERMVSDYSRVYSRDLARRVSRRNWIAARTSS